MGFEQVFDYMAGQADWLAFGLPTEGKQADKPRAGGAARRDVPTCGLADQASDVKTSMDRAGWDSCIVVNDERIVLGRIRRSQLDGDFEGTAGEIMDPGPSTVRQSEYLDALVKRMQKRDVDTIIVTSSIGELVGVLRRDEAEQRVAHKA